MPFMTHLRLCQNLRSKDLDTWPCIFFLGKRYWIVWHAGSQQLVRKRFSVAQILAPDSGLQGFHNQYLAHFSLLFKLSSHGNTSLSFSDSLFVQNNSSNKRFSSLAGRVGVGSRKGITPEQQVTLVDVAGFQAASVDSASGMPV